MDLSVILKKIEDIVCVSEPDDGVILKSWESPCHAEVVGGTEIMVYDHDHFSELGDALIDLYESMKQLVEIPLQPVPAPLPLTEAGSYPLNEADPIGFLAQQAGCVHKCLDDRGVAKDRDGQKLSLWGRVCELIGKPELPGEGGT